MRGGSVRQFHAAPVGGRDGGGRRSAVGGREHVGQRPERLIEHAAEEIGLRRALGRRPRVCKMQGDEVVAHSGCKSADLHRT